MAYISFYYKFRREEEEVISSVVNGIIPVKQSSNYKESASATDPAFVCTFHQKDSVDSSPSTSLLFNVVSAQLNDELSKKTAIDEASIVIMDTGHQKSLDEVQR